MELTGYLGQKIGYSSMHTLFDLVQRIDSTGNAIRLSDSVVVVRCDMLLQHGENNARQPTIIRDTGS